MEGMHRAGRGTERGAPRPSACSLAQRRLAGLLSAQLPGLQMRREVMECAAV